jgi:hypothetical protein
MDYNEITKLKDLLAEKETHSEILDVRLSRQQQLNAMPFYLRMQEPEYTKELKVLEYHQMEAFRTMICKKYDCLKKYMFEWEELFSMFFRDYLSGKVENMHEWIVKYHGEPITNEISITKQIVDKIKQIKQQEEINS